MLQPADGIDFPSNTVIFCRVEKVLDRWMLLIAAENFFGLLLPMSHQGLLIPISYQERQLTY